MARQANELAKEANLLSKDALKLPLKQYEMLTNPIFSARLSSILDEESGHWDVTVTLENIGNGSAVDVNATTYFEVDIFPRKDPNDESYRLHNHSGPIHPTWLFRLHYSTDRKFKSDKKTGKEETRTLTLKFPDEFVGVCLNCIGIDFKNEDRSKNYSQVLTLTKLKKSDWHCNLDFYKISPS